MARVYSRGAGERKTVPDTVTGAPLASFHHITQLLALTDQPGAAMSLTILHDEGCTIIRYRRAGEVPSRVLAVTFASVESVRDGRPGVAEDFLAASGYDCVTFKMHGGNFYDDLSFEEVERIVGPVAKQYPDVVTYGVSGGGYGALYFAEAVGACLSVGLSPRNDRDPDHARANKVPRMTASHSHRKLRELPLRRSAAIIILDPRNAIDRGYLDQEILPLGRCAVVPALWAGHSVAGMLHEASVLKSVLLAGLGNARDPDTAHREIDRLVRQARAERHRSPTYLVALAARVSPRRPRAFETIVRSIPTESLRGPIIRKLAAACRRRERTDLFEIIADAVLAGKPHPSAAAAIVEARRAGRPPDDSSRKSQHRHRTDGPLNHARPSEKPTATSRLPAFARALASTLGRLVDPARRTRNRP